MDTNKWVLTHWVCDVGDITVWLTQLSDIDCNGLTKWGILKKKICLIYGW